MKRLLLILSIAMLTGLALPSLGMGLGLGTFTYCGYTITITPTDPDHPGQAGTIAIDATFGDGEDATVVNLDGTYLQTDDRPPTLIIELSGTIQTPEGTTNVDDTWTFAPREKKMVWKTIIAWVESLIAS